MTARPPAQPPDTSATVRDNSAGARTATVDRRRWTAYWLWMCLLTIAYYTLPTVKTISWTAIGISASAAIVVGVVVHRPRRRLPWLLVSLGLLIFVAGDALYLVITDVLDRPLTDPSFVDALYLAMYPLLMAGLLLLPRSSTLRDRGGVVDALVLAAGLGLLSWIFLISPFLEAEGLSTLQRLVPIAYPVFDVLFLVVAASLLTMVSRSTAVDLLAVGGIALLVADVAYGLARLGGSWSMGGVVDLGWIVFYATWGAAALHPSMAALTEPKVLRENQMTSLRLVILTGAALIPPSVLFIESARGTEVDAVPIAILSAAVFLLVLLRLAGAVRGYRRATDRERALRQAGAALTVATEVDMVRSVVLSSVARLFQPGAAHAAAFPLKEDTERDDAIEQNLRDAFIREPGPTRFIRTEEVHATGLQHLRAYEFALVVPLIVTGRRTGSPLIGTLVVAADDERLGALRGSLEVLCAQAALAIERINLSVEVARRDSEQYFRTLVQHARDVILIIDDAGKVRYASPSAEVVFGDASLPGRPVVDLVIPAQRDLARQALDRIQAGEDPPGMAHWSTQRPDGSVVELEASFRDLRSEPTVQGIVVTVSDVTERRRLDQELRYLAFHDSLTGLVNRVGFADQVRQAVEDSSKRGGIVGVLLVDVDDFKMVNDTMGHEIGDQLLRVVARRLSAIVRAGDTAARLGGDEFAVLVDRAADPSDVEQLADTIVAALAEPVTLGGSLLSASASIGVATTADESVKGDLLRQADLALYVAKGAGKGRWRRYRPELHAAMVARMELRSALDRAVAREEFALMYQPIVRLSDGFPVGLEALLRWNDPERGLVPPSEFIEAAEDSGLIVQMGEWALRRSLADATDWPSLGVDGPPYLSLNISVRQFHQTELIDTIGIELRRSGLPPHCLQLEITESLLLRHDERVWGDLARLRETGIRVAIDDFGTGYSSLSYLRQVAVDVLKIDKTFVEAMTTSTQQRSLVETIVRLAHTLGLQVVAEGIERRVERDMLMEMGCRFGQGYLFAKPMSQEDTLRWLRSYERVDGSA